MIIKKIIPMTGNKYLRSHWARQRKERRMWAALIAERWGFGPWHLRTDNRNPPGKPCRVRVMVCRGKLQDEDNFRLSLKPVYDALVRTGWLYDDAPKWVARDDVEIKVKGRDRRCTLIQVSGTLTEGDQK